MIREMLRPLIGGVKNILKILMYLIIAGIAYGLSLLF